MKSAFLGGKMNDFCLKQGQGLKVSMAQSSTQTSQVPPPPSLLGSGYLYPPPLKLSLLGTQMNNVRNDLQSTVVSYKMHPGKKHE